MGKKDKKKGKGAEKTAIKTEKKLLNKLKKSLAVKGEDEIEKLIVKSQEQSKRDFCAETSPQPSARSGFSFCAHPGKDEIILFGGEFYNGSQTTMFDELYFYNIKKDRWTIYHSPEKPPPRSSHQAVAVPHQGGQLWVFGGEFVSPSRSSFYHYKDLWMFLFTEKKWHPVKAAGGPSARSGHRMVASQKNLIVFGGFQESVCEYRYFNDVYLFNLESYTWTKIDATGKIPSPRSACQMAALSDGRIMVYGGYCREKVKKDVDKGIPFTDMFYLHLDERTDPPKWKWTQVKASGTVPCARSGFSLAVGLNDRAFCFGGVQDEDPDDESLNSVFYNDLYLLELKHARWHLLSLRGKPQGKASKEDREIEEPADNSQTCVKISEDSVFSVRIGPQVPEAATASCSSSGVQPSLPPLPKPRMNAGLLVKDGVLYLYGGLLEEGDRQITLSDFHRLDTQKLDGWQTIVPCSTDGVEWFESEESSEEEDSEDSDENSDEEMDTL